MGAISRSINTCGTDHNKHLVTFITLLFFRKDNELKNNLSKKEGGEGGNFFLSTSSLY